MTNRRLDPTADWFFGLAGGVPAGRRRFELVADWGARDVGVVGGCVAAQPFSGEQNQPVNRAEDRGGQWLGKWCAEGVFQ